MYVRGFDARSGKIEDEPEKEAEAVLTVRLTVRSDLEPSWSLVSDRAEAQGQTRNLSWGDRVRLAPTSIDDDLKPTEAVEAAFIAGGGKVIAWRNGRALEDRQPTLHVVHDLCADVVAAIPVMGLKRCGHSRK
jgi:hypothetical protein